MKNLVEVLTSHNIPILPVANSGQQEIGDSWCRLYSFVSGENTLLYATFGIYRKLEPQVWRRPAREWTAEELAAKDAHIQALELHFQKLKASEQKRVALQAEKDWGGFSETGENAYLKRKGLQPEAARYGCRVSGELLRVPVSDLDGKIWNYQTISAGGEKRFVKKGRKKGCFHVISPLSDPMGGRKKIYLAEGLATAATIFEALEGRVPVVCTFDAGNLAPVALALRKKYRAATLVFCADDDRHGKGGKPASHAGEKAARAAAQGAGGVCEVLLPRFSKPQEGLTDFNDLHTAEGLEQVRFQLVYASAEDRAPGVDEPAAEKDGGNGVEIVRSGEEKCVSVEETQSAAPEGVGTQSAVRPPQKKASPSLEGGKSPSTKKPLESITALTLLRSYGERIVKQGRDLFLYQDGAWRWQSERGKDLLKQELASIAGPLSGSHDLENTLRYLLIHTPHVPEGVDLFAPPNLFANFLNGTLHVRPKPKGETEMEFLPHRPEDFIATQIPFNYPGTDALRTAKNPEFDSMLERIFQGDPDREMKQRALAQMFGAALVPCYPKIFFLIGMKGSGKSTVMGLLNRLLSPKNVSHVDPTDFYGFHMDSMAGKLVNLVTDINTVKTISDSIVKQIIDRVPLRISRKFQDDLLAPLPPLHIWGGNALPKSLEGATGTYERRVVILKFGAFSAEALGPKGYDLLFEDLVWQAGWEGILAFSLRGLEDLIRERGHYTVPASSSAELDSWNAESDVLGQFLDEIRHGEVDGMNQYSISPQCMVSRKDLWTAFSGWQKSRCGGGRLWSPVQLYRAMHQKKFMEHRTKTERFFIGIGVKAAPNAVC